MSDTIIASIIEASGIVVGGLFAFLGVIYGTKWFKSQKTIKEFERQLIAYYYLEDYLVSSLSVASGQNARTIKIAARKQVEGATGVRPGLTPLRVKKKSFGLVD